MSDSQDDDDTWISVLMGLVSVVTFLGSWAYAVATYGWFLGLSLGWIPALILAGFAYILSPLILLGLPILVMIGVFLLWASSR